MQKRSKALTSRRSRFQIISAATRRSTTIILDTTKTIIPRCLEQEETLQITGLNTRPVICITFQHKGNETLATIPIYGAVYRAIGTIIGRSRVYIVLIEGDAWDDHCISNVGHCNRWRIRCPPRLLLRELHGVSRWHMALIPCGVWHIPAEAKILWLLEMQSCMQAMYFLC